MKQAVFGKPKTNTPWYLMFIKEEMNGEMKFENDL